MIDSAAARAGRGDLPGLTGLSAPYEVPVCPEVRIDTAAVGAGAAVEQILEWLRAAALLPAAR